VHDIAILNTYVHICSTHTQLYGLLMGLGAIPVFFILLNKVRAELRVRSAKVKC
jgi:hypothetical protein